MTRFLLTAIAVAAFALNAAPAEARRATNTPIGATKPIEVAAIPAYPIADQVKAQRQPSLVASHSAKRSGTRHIRAAEVPNASPEPRQWESGVVRSAKTGATALVAPAHRAAFQSYIDDLEANGATVRFMGGIRRGPCWSGGLHPCGKALDVCQTTRGHVDRRCHLPGARQEIALAAKHGLHSGAIWCHSDYGHIQTQATASSCQRNLYAAVGEFHAKARR